MLRCELFKILSSFTLIFLLFGCSSPTENNNETQATVLEPTLTASSETARPGDFITIKAEVNKAGIDSLEGIEIDWTFEGDLEVSYQEGGVSALFIPSDYSQNEVTITGSLNPLSSNNSSIEYGEKSISIEIENNNRIPVEEVNGTIQSDTIWDENKVYKLNRDLEIQNGATLTLKNNAIIHLNGNDISSNDGTINFEGTADSPVKLVIDGGIDVPIIEANYLKAIGINERQSIDNLKNLIITRENLIITNSEIYGSVLDLRGGGQVSESHSSISVTNGGEFTIENSRFYDLVINDGNGSIENNIILQMLFRNGRENNIRMNNITYLLKQNVISNTGITNNNIYKVFISDLLDLHENNIGIRDNSFFKNGELPIIGSPINSNHALSQEIITLLEESNANNIRELDFTNNYWADDITNEFEEKGTGSNISYIYDYYDDSSLDKVIYKNWSEENFPPL